jgi:hypothetical protein
MFQGMFWRIRVAIRYFRKGEGLVYPTATQALQHMLAAMWACLLLQTAVCGLLISAGRIRGKVEARKTGSIGRQATLMILFATLVMVS